MLLKKKITIDSLKENCNRWLSRMLFFHQLRKKITINGLQENLFLLEHRGKYYEWRGKKTAFSSSKEKISHQWFARKLLKKKTTIHGLKEKLFFPPKKNFFINSLQENLFFSFILKENYYQCLARSVEILSTKEENYNQYLSRKVYFLFFFFSFFFFLMREENKKWIKRIFLPTGRRSLHSDYRRRKWIWGSEFKSLTMLFGSS